MNLKIFFISFFLLFSTVAFGQKLQKSMIGFVSDNDAYSSIYQDRYYTNGLTIQFHFMPKITKDKLKKKIFTVGVGQYIFTPFHTYVSDISIQDRPFAGYLFLNFSINNFYKNESSIRITFQLGVLGPASQAENVQNWFHRVFHFTKVEGWKYQIQNQPGINIQTIYFRNIAYTNNRVLDFNVFGSVVVGTIFDEARIGFISRIDFRALNPISNSILFNSNLNTKKTKYPVKEAYFFIKPELTYVAYDATIQGSMFNVASPLTFQPKRLKASIQIGFKWAIRRFNFGYAVSFITKTVNNNRVKAHRYGTISVAFRF